MKTMKLIKGFSAVLGSAVLGLTIATISRAATDTVDVNVTFAAPITVTASQPLRFGLLDIAMASTNTVTVTHNTTSDPQGNIVGGTQAAAEVTVTATAGQAITITADTFSGANYYTLSSFQCDYGGAAGDSPCGSGYSETSVASTTLFVGATLTKNATPALAGADPSTFDVTVVYQ